MNTLIVILLAVVSTQSAKFPPSFKKCNRKDPDADKCYLEAAQNGIQQLTKSFPEINLSSFNPMEVAELTIGAGSQGVVNVEQKFKNCKIYGIQSAKFEDLKFNFDEKYAYTKILVPEIRKLCQYELNGKILLLPIVGNGASTVILKNVKISAAYNFEEIKKKGKTFMRLSLKEIKFLPGNIFFNFENLFNGDKALGDNINKVLNDNSKEVFQDVEEGYELGFGKIIESILNGLFSKVSMEEAFD